MSEISGAEKDYLDFSVGIIEVNFRGKYQHMWELLMDFSKHGEGAGLVDEVGNGSYKIVLSRASGEMKNDPATGHANTTAYGVFHVKDEITDIRTPTINGNMKRWIDAAKNAREKFIGYLKEKEIPHNVLLTLFDD